MVDNNGRVVVRLVNPYDVHERRRQAGGRATAAAAVLAGTAGLVVLAAGTAAADTPEGDAGDDPFAHLDAAPAGSGAGTGSSDLFSDAPPVDGSGADLFSIGSDAAFGVADEELPALDPAFTPLPPLLFEPPAAAEPVPAPPVEPLFSDPAPVTDPPVIDPTTPPPAVLPAPGGAPPADPPVAAVSADPPAEAVSADPPVLTVPEGAGEPPTPPVPDVVGGAGPAATPPVLPDGTSGDGTTPTADATGSGAGGGETGVQVEAPGDAGAPQDGSGPVPAAAAELLDAGLGWPPAPGTAPPTSDATPVTPDPSVPPADPAAAGTGADPQGVAATGADAWSVGETSPETTALLDALAVPPGDGSPAAGPPPDGSGPGAWSAEQPGEPDPADLVFGVTTQEETASLDEALAPAMGSGAPSEAVGVWENALGSGAAPADPVFGVTTREQTASLDEALAPAMGSGAPSEAVGVWEDAFGTGSGSGSDDLVFGVTTQEDTASLEEALAPASGSGAPSEALRAWEDASVAGSGEDDTAWGVTTREGTDALAEALAPAVGSTGAGPVGQVWQDTILAGAGASGSAPGATVDGELATPGVVSEQARWSGSTAVPPRVGDGATGQVGSSRPTTGPGRPDSRRLPPEGPQRARPSSPVASPAFGETVPEEASRLPGQNGFAPPISGPGRPVPPDGQPRGRSGDRAGQPASGEQDAVGREMFGPPTPGAGGGADTADGEQDDGWKRFLPTASDYTFTGLSGISTLLNGAYAIQQRSLAEGVPLTYRESLQKSVWSLGPSAVRDLTLSTVNREPILENPFADIGAKAVFGTGTAWLTQRGARAVNPLVNRALGTSGADEVRLDSPHTMTTFGMLNTLVPVFKYAGGETLEAVGLEDNRLARDLVNAASVCAGVAGSITIGNRAPGVSILTALTKNFAWPTCRNSGGASLVSSVATNPPEGANFGVLGQAIVETCADRNLARDLLEQLYCSGGPPGQTPPAAGSSPAVPGAPGDRQLAMVPAVVPVDGVEPPATSPAFRSPVATSPVTTLPVTTPPASTETTTTDAAQPGATRIGPDGSQQTYIGGQILVGDDRPGTSEGKIQYYRAEDGTIYAVETAARRPNPNGTETRWKVRQGTEVSSNPAAEQVTSVQRVTTPQLPPGTPVETYQIRTREHTETLAGGGPNSVPGSITYRPAPDNPTQHDVVVRPTRTVTENPDGSRYVTFSARIPQNRFLDISALYDAARTGATPAERFRVSVDVPMTEYSTGPIYVPAPLPALPDLNTDYATTRTPVTTPTRTPTRTPDVTPTPPRPTNPTPQPQPQPSWFDQFVDRTGRAVQLMWDKEPITVRDVDGDVLVTFGSGRQARYDRSGRKLSGDPNTPAELPWWQVSTPGQALEEATRLLDALPDLPTFPLPLPMPGGRWAH